ncbi:PilN domain-containing protein [Motiliproteus sp. SC1-56]|uniref:PilN domain-containing protein n=1 Tax=Motiliproteus sp. SC1-56 TaxID=2799565 RepID=UPI001A9043A3|nr:PilN domain-containing protein [Motiliproteus sp. SC1-56]
MKQRINLYVRREKKRLPFSAGICLLVLLAVGTTVLAAYLFSASELKQARAELAALRTEQASLQAELDQLQQHRAQLVASPALATQIARLEGTLATKQEYLALLGALEPAAQTPFSVLLDGLAAQSPSELWLTRIQAAEGGRLFSLEGRSLRAGLVPEYLQRLGAEPGYRQARFDDFSLEQGEGRGLRFELNARLVPGVDGES